MNEQGFGKKFLELYGFGRQDMPSIVGTIVAKCVSLVLAILFWVLRYKACKAEKRGKKIAFTVLAVLFTIGIFTSRAVIDAPDDNMAFDEDFEDDFREGTQ
ncbi:MAG: hypothetical protein FWB87_10920 [Defluviitaleaceae bacterium]|nr:hypothetical protein [Defluviitaleaceae bacterium]MCL2261962.1 hypothetical protein [Defluviitaleaceae bacterium]